MDKWPATKIVLTETKKLVPYARNSRVHSEEQVAQILGWGVNVAVVYANELPETDFDGFQVINGDENDLRFLDPLGVVVGLKYKKTSATEEDKNGFVRELKFANAVLETA